MLEDEPLHGEQPNVVAQVSGLSDPVWLAREVDNGEKGDLGVKGPVEKISEPDSLRLPRNALPISTGKRRRSSLLSGSGPSKTSMSYPERPNLEPEKLTPVS